MSVETSETVTVGLDGRGYDIVIGDGLLGSSGWRIRPLLARPRTITVTDENVARHHLTTLEDSLREADIDNTSIILPAGEQTKDWDHLKDLVDKLLDLGIERSTTLIALGGGVIGDITGFAASMVLRGVPFIQMPTTLLAQVDSSVGGKTGINATRGKNLIGSFYQPIMVLIDTLTLETLPKRQVLAGYGEVVKYGLIADRPFFDWLEANGASLRDGDRTARRHAVAVSCRAKADIVAEDEREAGRRGLLNFGHTFAHAFEAETGFGDRLLHGEAVAIGMAMAFDASARLGHCSADCAAEARTHMRAIGLPVDLKGLADGSWTAQALYDHMKRDKKVQNGTPTFILVNAVGHAFTSRNVDEAAVLSLLDDALKASQI